MRLSALSRKIDKTPTQLTAFLEKKGIFPDKGLHTILDDETVTMVLSHFLPKENKPTEIKVIAPALVEEKVEEKIIEKEIEVKKTVKAKVTPTAKKKKPEINQEIKEEIIAEIPEPEPMSIPLPVKSETPAAEKPEPKIGTVDDMESDNFKEVELIKAKKVKLDGFKVVGKIDLPEKPVKVVKDEESGDPEKTVKTPRKENQKFDRDRKKNRGASLRNPLPYEERLKREEREKERQKKKKQREDKLRNKKLYEETVKTKTVNTPKKKKSKKYEAKVKAASKPIKSKNPIIRLWDWLNGKYDRF